MLRGLKKTKRSERDLVGSPVSVFNLDFFVVIVKEQLKLFRQKAEKLYGQNI